MDGQGHWTVLIDCIEAQEERRVCGFLQLLGQ
jgi:hypothetical protein